MHLKQFELKKSRFLSILTVFLENGMYSKQLYNNTIYCYAAKYFLLKYDALFSVCSSILCNVILATYFLIMLQINP